MIFKTIYLIWNVLMRPCVPAFQKSFAKVLSLPCIIKSGQDNGLGKMELYTLKGSGGLGTDDY